MEARSQTRPIKIRPREKVLVVGVGLKNGPSESESNSSTDSSRTFARSLPELKESLNELEELVAAAGGEVVGAVTQLLTAVNPATLIGSGKVDEIGLEIQECGVQVVVIDHALSGVQTRNLEKAWGVRVLDRSQVILDIFALRAQTYEGKLQVELAQMLDQLPRMVDAWMGSLSRQGGGIGTRGPGETALELDRRRIRDRMKQIRRHLDDVRAHRSQHRASRRRAKVPSFALIGYTNSGKSTLLNRLTNSQVLAKDQLFATLDPTTRKVFLPHGSTPNSNESHGSGTHAVLTDTVGFIRKLPHELVEAFKATLEESAEADILIHVVDLASGQMAQQIETVQALIDQFGWAHKPIIHVFNKIDVAPFDRQFQVKLFPRVFVSAQTGEGIDRLKRLMAEAIEDLQSEVELFLPKQDEGLIFELSRQGRIVRSEPGSTGTLLSVQMTSTMLKEWQRFRVTAESVG
jgi:GTP-binding protein HflX